MATRVKLVAYGVITPDQITLTTASTGTNTTAPATTAFVQQEISALVDSSPEALNTLNELAAALGDDANFSTTVTNSIATKAPLASPTLTGTPKINVGTNKNIIFSGGIGEIGNVPGFQGINDAGSSNTDIGMRGNSIRFATGSSERMRIDSSGNLLIGPTSGTSIQLHVDGSRANGLAAQFTNSQSSTGSGIVVKGGNNSSTYSADFRDYNNSSLMRIRGDGNVGIGTSNPAVTLDVTGNGRFDSVSGNALRLDRVTSGNNIDIDFHNPIGTAGVIAKIRVDGDGLSNLYGALSFHTGTTPDSPSEAMRIDRLGHVGIGMTPAAVGSDTVLSIYNSATPRIKLHNSTTGTASGDGGEINMSSSDFILENREAGNVRIFNNGSERLRIDSAGTLYQGTTTPTLHSATTGIVFTNGSLLTDIPRAASRSITLAQNAAVDSGNTFAYLVTDEASAYQQFNGNHYFMTAASGSAGSDITFDTKLLVHNTGCVGVGSSADRSLGTNIGTLVVNGSAGGGLWLSPGDSSAMSSKIYAQANGSVGDLIINNGTGVGSGGIRIQTNGTEKWRIDSAGRMTNAFDAINSSILQVAGNSVGGGVVNFIDPDVSVATSNHILRCTFSVDTDSQGKFIAFYDSGGNIGSVSQNGAAAVSFNTTSDERLKENIVDASSQLNVINNIQVREFDWKSSNKHDIGMIAQELNEVIPNLVQEGGDDVTEEPWVVDYGKLTPYLVKAIQEQQTIIDDLKSRIETLEG